MFKINVNWQKLNYCVANNDVDSNDNDYTDKR